jgi:hypothetical protein
MWRLVKKMKRKDGILLTKLVRRKKVMSESKRRRKMIIKKMLRMWKVISPKKPKQMSEDEEGKEQSKYSPGNEAVDWTIESVEITKDVFLDDDKENEEADSGSHTKKTRI